MSISNGIPFSALDLPPELARAIEEMGFETATDIQSRSIPLIRAGYDVIGRSQTGTGKTLAFGIPALEKVDIEANARSQVQVLVLCPTRELAVQACEELRKLARHMHGIHPVEVYGGAPMDRQILRLKKANVVVGTPGRIMDHMRRRTLRLGGVRLVVLDEADEMLSMGFREDIETILQDTPQERQTVLFSATMPPAILKLTQEYQRQPQLIEIDREQVTVSGIDQSYYEVPAGRKSDALKLLLRYHEPKRAIIFCNTKKMVEELNSCLGEAGFSAEGLHGDMKQSQRSQVMEAFKRGRTAVLIATDVAARGIDVSDIDFVINYDVPQHAEYYVHRIGRTGRAGKAGRAFTLCCGRRQVQELLEIGRSVRSRITRQEIPDAAAMAAGKCDRVYAAAAQLLEQEPEQAYLELVAALADRAGGPERLAAALLEHRYGSLQPQEHGLTVRQARPGKSIGGHYGKIVLSIGRSQHVAPNHLVGAIAERTQLNGREIGKIEIFDDKSVVAVPEQVLEEVVQGMDGCKICGRPVTVSALQPAAGAKGRSRRPHGAKGGRGRQAHR